MGFGHAPRGAMGGNPGRKCRVVVNGGTSQEIVVEDWKHEIKPEDTLAFEAAGGGGFGNAFERDPDLVLRDIAEGYVTLEGARIQYGVAIVPQNEKWVIDLQATKELRLSKGLKQEL